ncbi:Snf7-domain-containing protein [Phyllosticta citricarpa]|uniref:Snf7-domain-containing protein n=1 Tax=Phyllosticta citricarpa TaxID=55181 RepID=A0ABR1LRA0_9PEZI
MGNTSSSRKISAQDRAILDLKIQRDKLHQYQKKITAITTRETEIAKECLKLGDKRRALLALRRKKYQESLLQKTDAQLAQLEMLTSDVEFALVQKDVLFGLQQGTNVLKEIHREMGGIENVEKLMGESEEAQAYQKVSDSLTIQGVREPFTDSSNQEISEMLAGRMSNQDEDEVEDELDALEAEMTGNKVAEPLPDAPTKTPEDEEAAEADRGSARERAQRRAREQESRQAEPMLA